MGQTRKKQKVSQLDKLNRRAKRRRRTRMLQFSVLGIVLVVAVIVCVNVFVVAKTICVENNTPYSSAELLQAAGYRTGSGLYSVNSESAIKRLSEKYPYVRNVKVTYSFPTTAYFVFENNKAVFCLAAEDGGYVYLDDSLKVLQRVDEPEPDKIFVSGMIVGNYTVGQNLSAQAQDLDTELLRDVFEGISAGELSDSVTGIDLTKKYDIKFTVAGVISIELGNSEDLGKKIETAKLIMARNDPQKKARINVKNYRQGRYMELLEDVSAE